MKSLNLGKETGHEHQDDEHVDHDHRGLGLRSRRDQQSRNEQNTTWDQVCRQRELSDDGILQEPLPNISSQINGMILTRWFHFLLSSSASRLRS